MKTDEEIRIQGIETLIDNLGLTEAGRFISLMNRDGFDYTEWRENLWKDKSVEEISCEAMKIFKPKS